MLQNIDKLVDAININYKKLVLFLKIKSYL